MARIEDIAEQVAMGPFGSSIKVSTFVDTGIPVISGEHLNEARLSEARFNFVAEEHADQLRRANVERGDVVLTHAGNIGQVSYIPAHSQYDRYIISQRQFYVRCDGSKMLPEFLTYYLRSREGQHKVLANASQTGVPSIAQPVSYVKTVEVPTPPVAEQRAITDVLVALDDKIESNRRLVRTSELILDAEATHLAGTAVALAELVEVSRTVTDPQALADTEVDLFSIPAFDSVGRPERVVASLIKSGKSLVDAESVLLSRLNPRIPRLWHVVPDPARPALCSTEFMVLRPSPSLTLADVWVACRQPIFLEEMVQRATGTSGSHQRVRPDDVLTIEVADPRGWSAEARDEATVLLNLIGIARRENDRLAALRDTLLPELMSGRLSVKGAERVAEALV